MDIKKEMKEFFNSLNYIIKDLLQEDVNLEKELKLYECFFTIENNTIYYNVKKLKNMFINNKRKLLTEILVNIYGENFFIYDEEKRKKLREKNYYTKEDLYSLLSRVCKRNNDLKLPNSYDEFYDFIRQLFMFEDNKNNVKEYSYVLGQIEGIIIKKYKSLLNLSVEKKSSIKSLKKILKDYNNKNKIKIHDVDTLVFILNQKEKQDGISLPLGNLTLKYIDEYNNYIEEKKKTRLLNQRINGYYKKIRKTSISDMDNTFFPTYLDSDAEQLYDGIYNKFKDPANLDENMQDKYAIFMINYADYVKSKNK